jgi:regulation of enolase protein 1 (concanavalin A-like superfamily)
MDAFISCLGGTNVLFLRNKTVMLTEQSFMQWFNHPLNWKEDGNSLSVTVQPDTDYWQITHYGFKRDNGPFYFLETAGNFEASVKITGNYQELYHQAGLMIRVDESNWIKTGIEFVNGFQNVSAVVTRFFSDWSVVANNENPASVWLKLLRKDDYVEISYSFNNQYFQMLRLAYFPPTIKVQIGMFAAAPGKKNFAVIFEDFKVEAK